MTRAASRQFTLPILMTPGTCPAFRIECARCGAELPEGGGVTVEHAHPAAAHFFCAASCAVEQYASAVRGGDLTWIRALRPPPGARP